MLQAVSSKLQPEVSITDESFDSVNAYRFRLLLKITDDALTLIVLNTSNNKFILLRDYNLADGDMLHKLEELFSSGEYLSNVNYKSTTISITSSKTTLVPSPFYDLANNRKVLAFNHSLKPDDVVFSNYVRSFDLYNVFAIPKDLDELLKSNFRNYNLFHSANSLMEGVHLEFGNISLPGLFVNAYKKTFELIITNGKQLLFYNNFQYETPEDFAYYMLFVAEQLQINPELNPVTLSGRLQEESPVYAFLYKYFRNINFADHPEPFKYHFGFEKIPSHTYFSVFSQALCE